MNWLKGIADTLSRFPYSSREDVHSYVSAVGTRMKQGVKKEDGTPVSLFTFEKANSDPDAVRAADNAHKRLRMLRHPYILRLIEGFDNETSITLVTERVTPLREFLKAAAASETKERYVAAVTWGLYQVITAAAFLNNDCGMNHLNLCPESIFVTDNGDWRLAGFELTAPVGEPPAVHGDVHPPAYRSPERVDGGLASVRGAPPGAHDAWSVGCLAYEVYTGELTSATQLQNTQALPDAFCPFYQQLLQSAPGARCALAAVRDGAFFAQSDIVQAQLFLENMAIREQNEREVFFKQLPRVLPRVPIVAAKRKILPTLVQAVASGMPASHISIVMTPMLQIGKELSEEEYQEIVVPGVVQWFASNDRSMRIAILKHMSEFGPHLPEKIVNEKVFPAMLVGFTDSAPALREATIKGVLPIAEKLSPKNLESQLLRHLEKLLGDQEQPIRTNAIICISKLARHFSQEQRDTKLVPLYARAVRDTNRMVRATALKALHAALPLFSAPVLAVGVLPTVCVLLADEHSAQREGAAQVVRSCMRRLEEHSFPPDPEPPAPETAPAARPTTKPAADAGIGALSSDTSVLVPERSAPVTSHSRPTAASLSGKAAGGGVGGPGSMQSLAQSANRGSLGAGAAPKGPSMASMQTKQPGSPTARLMDQIGGMSVQSGSMSGGWGALDPLAPSQQSSASAAGGTASGWGELDPLNTNPQNATAPAAAPKKNESLDDWDW